MEYLHTQIDNGVRPIMPTSSDCCRSLIKGNTLSVYKYFRLTKLSLPHTTSLSQFSLNFCGDHKIEEGGGIYTGALAPTHHKLIRDLCLLLLTSCWAPNLCCHSFLILLATFEFFFSFVDNLATSIVDNLTTSIVDISAPHIFNTNYLQSNSSHTRYIR